MGFYLVTQSAAYYPQAGTGDWLSVHTDEAEARAAFESAHAERYLDVYLIAIEPPTWRVLAEKP